MSKNLSNDDLIKPIKLIGKKINTETDDYFLNPYKFEYNNHYCNLNDSEPLSPSVGDLDLIIKTLTSIIMSNSTYPPIKSNETKGIDNNDNVNEEDKNDKKDKKYYYNNFNKFKQNDNNNLRDISKNVNIIDSDNEKKYINQYSNVFKLVANNKFDELEKFVTDNKYSVNFQDIDGDTPLHIAVFLGSIRASEILINFGANIYIKDKWGQTSFHRICFCLDNPNILKIVNLFYKTNKNKNNNIFNEPDFFGNTSFHLILKYIIKNKIKMNKIHLRLIEKLKILTNIELRNKEGYSIEDLLLSM